MNATDVITEISYPDRGLLDSPLLWMALGALLAGVLVVLIGLAGAGLSRLLRHDGDNAPDSWELDRLP